MRGRVTLSSPPEADEDLDLRRITLSWLAAPLVGRRLLEHTADLDDDHRRRADHGRRTDRRRDAAHRGAQGRRRDGFVVREQAKADDLQRRVEGAAATIPDRDTGAGEIEAEGVPYRFLYSMQGLGLG